MTQRKNFLRPCQPAVRASAGLLAFSTLALTGTAALGEDPAGETVTPVSPLARQEESVREAAPLPDLTVIGSKEGTRNLPGSAYYVDTEEIRTQTYTDINRILRKVPGVYIREEDGYGLFPNISIRGVDPSRSSKVTIMEDGILQAPAAYSDPAAYFSPTAGRMSAIEVLKGSSQVAYGPHITGGVINYLSTPIPTEKGGYLKTVYGQDNETILHGYFGDTVELDGLGRFGYLVEGFRHATDGFREFASDGIPGFGTNGKQGYQNTDAMVKLMWEPDSDQYQRFEFKYGYTDRDSSETYLGISDEDFRQNPYQRYAASRFDRFDSYQNRTYLKHFIEISDTFSLESTAYYNNFHRNFYRLTGVNGSSDISGALAGGNPAMLDVIKGQAAGTFTVQANDRDYYSYGLQMTPRFNFEFAGADHQLELGLRYHKDRGNRNQPITTYTQDANGAIIGAVTAPATGGNVRTSNTEAYSLYLRDEIRVDRWTITPGIRIEHLQFEYDRPLAGQSGDESMTVWGGGIGLAYDLRDDLQLFGGVHRGYSTPNPESHIRDNYEEETSLAFEIGARYQHTSGLRMEAALFYTRFDDLIAQQNVGGIGMGPTTNLGRVDSYGLEFQAEYDALSSFQTHVALPLFFSMTYTHAELANDVTGGAGTIFGGGSKGNELPYIPQLQFTVGAGLEVDRLGIYATGSFVDSVFTTAFNNNAQQDPAGNPDARYGKLDSHFVVDLAAHYQLTEQTRLLAGVYNLLNEEYMASRQPWGPRAGRSRSAYVGLEINF